MARFKKVGGCQFFARCYRCEKKLYIKDEFWADLDGEPFKAYFCHSCKKEVERINQELSMIPEKLLQGNK